MFNWLKIGDVGNSWSGVYTLDIYNIGGETAPLHHNVKYSLHLKVKVKIINSSDYKDAFQIEI